VFGQKTRAQWCESLQQHDVCFAPVLSLSEAHSHPHHRARETFIVRNGLRQPAPVPRFSRTPAEVERGAPACGEGASAALAGWGFDEATVARFLAGGARILPG
jgi:alpha-methylacyl-CoA racemase